LVVEEEFAKRSSKLAPRRYQSKKQQDEAQKSTMNAQ
jgi:hypothetical protein